VRPEDVLQGASLPSGEDLLRFDLPAEDLRSGDCRPGSGQGRSSQGCSARSAGPSPQGLVENPITRCPAGLRSLGRFRWSERNDRSGIGRWILSRCLPC